MYIATAAAEICTIVALDQVINHPRPLHGTSKQLYKISWGPSVTKKSVCHQNQSSQTILAAKLVPLTNFGSLQKIYSKQSKVAR